MPYVSRILQTVCSGVAERAFQNTSSQYHIFLRRRFHYSYGASSLGENWLIVLFTPLNVLIYFLANFLV